MLIHNPYDVETTPGGPGSAPSGATRFVGVDVGGTNIKSVVLSQATGTPEVIEKAECATTGTTPVEILQQVAEIARGHLDRSATPATLGFSLPGAVDRRTGVTGVMPNLPGVWHGVPAVDIVSGITGVQTSIVNDARAFALAESRLGAARGLRVVVGVTLGTGLGGGIVVNGSLLEGTSGFAGELGHQIVSLGGARCGCGNRGCAETFVKTQALVTATGLPSAQAVFRSAAQGELAAVSAVGTYIAHLAVALANVHTLLCPDAFVIGGGIAEAEAQLFHPLLDKMKALIMFDHPTSVHLRKAMLGPWAGAIGAALVASDATAALSISSAGRWTRAGVDSVEWA
ncbi:Glucokinase [Propionicimonas sp. T2.31MG-18]|uniref:ROK family protein n=1 Tax=Propionicimonas sp. T2.31MG-18 TaxID=3157620 RepID=UPI0035E7E930